MTLSDVTVRRRLLLLGIFTNLLLVGAVALGAYASWRISLQFDEATHRLERIVAAAESADAGQGASGTKQLTSLLRIAATQIQRDADIAEEERLRTLLYLAVVTAVTLIASTVVGLATARSIVRPLEGVVGMARSVAAGDLTTQVASARRDELGDVLRSLAEMNSSLVEVVTRVQEGAQAVKGAATEIASGTDDLSARTDAQAASLQQTAASIEQMTAAVERNALAARRANTLAAEAAQVALGAGDMVEQMVSRMNDIQQRSRRIAEIVGLIDSIAFQTNILAINAAVEAARAGESGRGFAVVATEVRNLASRSAEAARQIKDLIGGAVAAVNTGAAIADDAGRAMIAVTTSVKDVSGIIGEISTATGEQQAGIGQINQAITELDRVTQNNAAMAQQSQRGSRALERMAERLERAVGFFRVEGGATRAAPLALPAGDD